MNIEFKDEYKDIINKPFYNSEDVAKLLDIGIQNARQIMRTEGFPLIECGEKDSLRPRLRVEATAFWRWARFKRNPDPSQTPEEYYRKYYELID